MHVVAVVALEGVVPFDLSIPCEVFGRTRLADGSVPYEVQVCGVARTVDAGAFTIRVRRGLRVLARADTILVPGMADPTRAVPPAVLQALRAAAARGARVASICSGAFVLAAAGLLDGLRATTHWLATAELARRHPAIDVQADVLYVDEGQILTSAGAAAGLDLCLHLVRRDHGAAVAAEAARLAVMPLERDGSQAQHTAHPVPGDDGVSLAPLLRWVEENQREPLTLDRMSRRVAMSARSLSRRFRDQTGTTPARWVGMARVRRALELLETSSHSVERIATEVGYGSAATLREHVRRLVGASPQEYRRTFQSAGAPGARRGASPRADAVRQMVPGPLSPPGTSCSRRRDTSPTSIRRS
jgi:transcriptional regulator GlxA family with amidase domain